MSKPKKRTQLEVLISIEELLKPINNLTRYYIQQINNQIKAQQDGIGASKTAAGEMAKEAKDEPKQ